MDERLVTGADMKALDENTIKNHGILSLVLMERAALASVEVLESEGFDLTSVLVFCGAGNNGGDGFAISRLLHLAGVNVKPIFVGEYSKRSEETCVQQKIAESYSIKTLCFESISDNSEIPENKTAGNEYEPTTIIDAIFGIGALRPPKGIYLDAINYINKKRESGTKILAIDIPSGVSADTGETPGVAVHADVTVTFAYNKVGMTIPPGSQLAGKIVVKDIGIY